MLAESSRFGWALLGLTERFLRKIRIGDADGIAVPDLLARDLAEDDNRPRPGAVAIRAGRRFTVDRSEKGGGTGATSPLTDRSTPRPPLSTATPLAPRSALRSS